METISRAEYLQSVTALDVIISLLFTWGIGLLPPLLIRFVILKRQIRKRVAIPLVAIFLLIQLTISIIINALAGVEGRPGSALGVVAFVSYLILRKKGAGKSKIIPDAQVGAEKKNDLSPSKKSNWIANNWLKLSILLLSFGTISLSFYWFGIRPAQIKHSCSWVKHHRDAIPEREGKTVDQLREEGKFKICPTETPCSGLNPGICLSENIGRTLCEASNQDVINKNKPQKYAPAKEWYEKATDNEYKFCLRDKGL